MANGNGNSKQNILYRVIVAVAFGLIGFWVNFLDIDLFESPAFKVSILLGLLFPLLIALAWGWRYGLLSALAGGCQTMWWLWRTDGYGLLYAVPVFTIWVVWHGYWADRRRKADQRRWYYSSLAVEIPFRVISELGFYTIFRWLVSLNPPPWNPSITCDYVALSWVNAVAAKHFITAYLLLLAARLLLSFAPVRRFFGLKKLPVERLIGVIYAGALLMGVLLWVVDGVVGYFAFNPQGQSFWDATLLNINPHDSFIRNMYTLVSVIAGVFVARLVTERAQAQESLRESETKYRTILENTGTATCILEDDTTISYCNKRFEQLAGYSKQDIEGKKSWTGFVLDEDLEQMKKYHHARRADMGKAPTRYEFRFVNREGDIRNIVLDIDMIEGSDKSIASLLDITERKRAEEEIAERRMYLEGVLRSTPDAIVTLDVLNRVVEWNLGAEKLFGYSQEEAVGQNIDHMITTTDVIEEAIGFTQRVLSGKEVPPIEVVRYRKDSSSVNVILAGSPILMRDELIGAVAVYTDITERVQAEETLRKYKHIISATGDHMSFLDRNYTYQAVNECYLKAHLKERREIVGHSVADLLGADVFAQLVKEKVDRCLSGEEVHYQAWFDFPGLGRRYMDVAYYPYIGVDGAVSGMVTSSHDITDLVQAEEALRESEQFLQDIFDGIQDGISALDVDLNILRVNAWMERLYASRAPLVGKKCYAVYQQRETPCPWCPSLPAMETGEAHSELVPYPSEENPTGWINLSAYPLKDITGRVVGVIEHVQDITERVQAEETLQKHAEQLEVLRQASLSLTSSLTMQSVLNAILEHSLKLVNADDAHIFLYDGEQLSFGAVLWKDDRTQEPFAKPRQNGLTYTVARSGKSVVIPDLSNHPLFSNWSLEGAIVGLPLRYNDKVFGVMNVALDQPHEFTKSELHILELLADQAAVAIDNAHLHEQVQRHAEELEQRVTERTQELRDAQEKMLRQERLATLGQIAGSMGHELRNPLGIISNAVYYLKMVQPDAGDKVKEYLDMIDSETRDAAKIISDLLGFARLNPSDQKDAAVSALVAETLAKHPPPANVEVDVRIPNDLPPLYVDPAQIGQVLANLIINAYQAMPYGGELSVFSEQCSVSSEQLLNTEHCILLTVSDTGTGIPPENMPKLFEPLFSTKPRGIGLGLAISKKLVEANGGSIEVESVEGQGSAFTLRLPLE